MREAGFDAKLSAPDSASRSSLGRYAEVVQATLQEAETQKVVKRIWEKDASLWKSDEHHQNIINNSLGWLRVPSAMLEVADELTSYAQTIRQLGEFDHVMVCGMGGSSLCPEVLRQTFGEQPGFPVPLVLDSTDPDAIHNFARQADISRCLFVIASKSGTTTEPLAFHKYWYNEVAHRTRQPGRSFVAITDPGSQMADTASEEGFQRIFLNQPDIGGRYSALSYFGMVPAALMGLDVKKLLGSAEEMALACAEHVAITENPGAKLGTILAECALAGRDKLTLIADDKLSALGLWIEQLVAESTGKEGKGIVPVVGEPLGPPSAYGNDRVFVSTTLGEPDPETSAKLRALQDAGHPVVFRTLADIYDLSGEFFLWEMAAAFAGWRLGINPFDQPNVQESKDATKALLEKFVKDGKLDEDEPLGREGALTVYGTNRSAAASVAEIIQAHCEKIRPGDYVALLAYVEETPEIDAALQSLRLGLRDQTHCATTVGYGPRFLHSTGQLHKGGPDSGVFFQLTASDKIDLAVPGAPYTFSTLKQAQAQGDYQSLLSHRRRAIRIDLGPDVSAGLRSLQKLIAMT